MKVVDRNMNNKTILIVMGECPYPVNHGGRFDIWNKIRIFREMGFKIDLLMTLKDTKEYIENEAVIKNSVENVYWVKRKNSITQFFSLLPLQVTSRNKLREIVLKTRYDYVLLEGEYVYAIFFNKTLKYKNIMLRMHNNEVEYFKQLTESTGNIVRKIYYYTDYLKFKFCDSQIMCNIKNILFVSYKEKIFYEKKFNFINSIFLPPVVKLNFKEEFSINKSVLFVGSLFMVNNQEAIKFYINNIHIHLTHMVKDYEFVIAGNSRGESLEWLTNMTSNDTNIKIYDTPKDLTTIYSKCRIFVNPMLHGAGVKLKTIEAIINGLPVVSTEIGNEGTGLKNSRDIFVSNDAKEILDYIYELLNNDELCKKLIFNGQKFLRENYKIKDILEGYIKKLK